MWFTDNPTAAPVTWQAGNNANLTITQFYPGHAVNPSNENISFGGTQDNGTEKYSGLQAWDHVTCGDGAWAAIDPNIPSTVYANCQNISILRSTLDGVASSWVGVTNELGSSGDRSLFIPPLVQDPTQSGRLYFGTFRVWQSMNFGNDWSPISPDLTSSTSNEVTSVSVAPSNNNVVYATTTEGRVWRSTNANAGAAATWTNLTAAPLPNRYATMVRTDHASADIAYLSYSGFSGFGDTVGHIFKTTNGGGTWTDISGTAAGALPNTPVNDIAVVHLGAPLNFDAIFIATDVGVFECPDPTSGTPCTTWSPVGTGLPKVPVVGLAFRQSSASLRAITHGRGVWVIEAPGVNATGLLLLTSITPSSAASGSGAFTMTFDGNDFGVPSGTPQVFVDGVNVNATNVTVINPNQMTATIPAAVTAAPGLHQISINQPGHAATPTGGITFAVTGPAPTLSLIAPNHSNAGVPAFPLTATGTNFACTPGPSETLIQFAGILLTPTACTATSIAVTVPANLVINGGNVTVLAVSPGPGGGNSAPQAFTIGAPDMTITKTHTGNFVQGQTGANFIITVTNAGGAVTTAPVSVVDVLPTGLTATAISGGGNWNCVLPTLTCTRSDALTGGASYQVITLATNVAANAPASLTNTATVSGGGETNLANNTATDTATILTPPAASLSANALSFTNQGVNSTSAAQTITVTNHGGATLTFTSAPTITGTNAANFASATGTTCTNGATVVGGGTCVINITFTPTATGSFGPATLTLTDNASPTTQTATLTGTGIDFSISGPTSAVSITAGQSGTFTITATPGTGGFANSITLSASGLPSAATATFTPASVTPGSTATTTTLSIATTARGALPPSSPRAPWMPTQLALWSFALVTILLITILFAKRTRPRRFAPAIFVTVALLLAIGIDGCGSNTPPAPTGTPAGTSTITVTATSGSLVHTTTVTLTVQ